MKHKGDDRERERHNESQRQKWEEEVKRKRGRQEREGGGEVEDGLGESDRDGEDESEGVREGLLSRESGSLALPFLQHCHLGLNTLPEGAEHVQKPWEQRHPPGELLT